VVIVYDGTNTFQSASIYINGELDTIAHVGGRSLEGYITYKTACSIGNNNPNDPYHVWDGKIDDIRIYSRALSVSEIQQLYADEQPSNHPPIANAGPNQAVQAGVSVQLNGANSTDPEGIGDIASFQWQQISGPAIILSDPTVVNPTFTAPNVGPEGASLVFRLVVTDKGGLTSEATCTVTVTWNNQPPVASAGPDQTVAEGQLVQLEASGSMDPDDGVASYFWRQTDGPTVVLSDPAAVNPSFTAPDVGMAGAALVFELTVVDNDGLQATDSCIVNVSWVNAPPVANAGAEQTVNERAPAMLDGSASFDPDDGLATYKWVQLSGLPVTLSDPLVPQPTFNAPDVSYGGEVLVFELTVADQGGLKSTAQCTVNVLWINTLPAVDAGENTVIRSVDQATRTLCGTTSDADGDTLLFRWLEGETALSSWQPPQRMAKPNSTLLRSRTSRSESIP
jgi:hypothetical protein